MIVDSSAIIAVIFKEPGFEAVLAKLEAAPAIGIGTPTLVETGIVLAARLGGEARGKLQRFLEEFDIVPIPFDAEHWLEALEAYERFGRGRHPARLNFGDCLSYAMAKLSGQQLLCTGFDFLQTDLDLA